MYVGKKVLSDSVYFQLIVNQSCGLPTCLTLTVIVWKLLTIMRAYIHNKNMDVSTSNASVAIQ